MLGKFGSKFKAAEILEAHTSPSWGLLMGHNAIAWLTAKYVKIAHILILLPKGGLVQKTGDEINV